MKNKLKDTLIILVAIITVLILGYLIYKDEKNPTKSYIYIDNTVYAIKKLNTSIDNIKLHCWNGNVVEIRFTEYFKSRNKDIKYITSKKNIWKDKELIGDKK